jgi:hypothetical protein
MMQPCATSPDTWRVEQEKRVLLARPVIKDHCGVLPTHEPSFVRWSQALV